MARTSLHFICFIFFTFTNILSFSQKFGFENTLRENPNQITSFCVPNNEQNWNLIKSENVNIKFGNENWLFISVTPKWIHDNIQNGSLTDFYFETAPPALLSDTARMHHFVTQVHEGSGGLQVPFTGKNVIVGIVDTGIDYEHPDFIDTNGNTRVLRYWDQSSGSTNSPYGYGWAWDSTAINGGTCTSTDNYSTGHGTAVAGKACGNGGACGQNYGMAPESDIVIVETNFSIPNWTLTVADACDYIFRVADTVGKPAVINLSLGTYFGSHDGNDPAAEFIEGLLDAKNGRIVVSAAGNSGNSTYGKYHHQSIVDSDTNFVWFLNNATGAYGANTIFFDLYSDIPDATFDFAIAADAPAPSYSFRGRTGFHGATSSLGTVIYDTIWNGANRIATIEVYTGYEGANYHMQMFVSHVDSTTYRYRFETTGSGKYDLWSGKSHGFNNMVSAIPTPAEMPSIIYYEMPDSLQTIVSSWNCSEKVVSVGNFRNRAGHISMTGPYVSGDPTPPGKISPNSSKGPSRHDLVKPEISAAGDVSLSAASFLFRSNPANNWQIDSNTWHKRDGGTSLACPVITGIAALYLEKCHNASYSNFINDITNTSYTDGYTGAVPNMAYGYGKAHALNLLLQSNFTSTIDGTLTFCSDPTVLSVNSASNIDSVWWSDNTPELTDSVLLEGDYFALAYDQQGCISYTDTVFVNQLIIPSIDPLILIGDTLSTNSTDDYQWTLNGSDIPGAMDSSYVVSPPYGTYTCYTTSIDGCVVETEAIVITVGLDEILPDFINIYPNPSYDVIQINSEENIIKVEVFDLNGKSIIVEKNDTGKYILSNLATGDYLLKIRTDKGIYSTKIVRL